MNFKIKPKKLIKNKVFVTITTDYNDGDYIKSTSELSVSEFDDMLPEIKVMISDSSRDDMGNYNYGEYPYQIWLDKARAADGDSSKKSLFHLLDMQPRDSDECELGHSLIHVEATYHDENGISWDVVI